MVDERLRAKSRGIGQIEIDQGVLLPDRIARPDRDELPGFAVDRTILAGDIPVVGHFGKIHLHGGAFDHFPKSDLFCVVFAEIEVVLELSGEVSHLGGVFDFCPPAPVFLFFFDAFAGEPEGFADFVAGGFPVIGDKGIPFAPGRVVDEVAGGFFFESDGVSFVVERVQQSVRRRELPAGHGLSLPGRGTRRVEEPEEERFFGSFGFVVGDVFFDGPTKIGAGIEGGDYVDEFAVFIQTEPVGVQIQVDAGMFGGELFCDRFVMLYCVRHRQGCLHFNQG